MKTQFKDYCIVESSDFLSKIRAELAKMDSYEVDDFGNYLYYEYLEDIEYDEIEDVIDGSDESYELIDIDEIMDIISIMDDDVLSMIYDDLMVVDSDDITENVTRKLHSNKNRRKFMVKSKTALRKEQNVRRRNNRMHKQDRKAYYKKNRSNILAYSRDYYTKNKAGKHFKKIRRKT